MVAVDMDRRIPPEPPPPMVPVKHDSLELKVKQGVQKDAFETALQRADHRRSMDAHDRIVSAGVKQAAVQLGREGTQSQPAEAKSALNELDSFVELPKSRHFELYSLETSAEFVQGDVPQSENNTHSPVDGSMPGQANILSEETITMLYRKMQTTLCALGESVAVELVDDPSGVLSIRLTRESDDSWSVNLSVAQSKDTQSKSEQVSDEDELVRSLSAQFQQSGLPISAVSVSADQYSKPEVKD